MAHQGKLLRVAGAFSVASVMSESLQPRGL